MQDSSVEKLFKEQAAYYAREDQSSAISPIIPLFLKWSKNKKGKISIAEFGGGGGQLLNEFIKKRKNLELTNIEYIDSYKTRQINKKIKFIKSSIINNQIADCSYDILIIRDVLHHLVGDNINSTKANQEKALSELKRIVKPNGVIFIEELVEESFLMSRFLYGLLKLNSYLKIRISKLDLGPNTRVLFFSKKNLKLLVDKVFKKSIIKNNYFRSNDIYNKLGHLGSNSGKMIIEIY